MRRFALAPVARIREAVNQLNTPDGVLVLTDMFGGPDVPNWSIHDASLWVSHWR